MPNELEIPRNKATEVLDDEIFRNKCLNGALLYDAIRDEETRVLDFQDNCFVVEGPPVNADWLKRGERYLIITDNVDLAKEILESKKDEGEILREKLSLQLRKTGLAPSSGRFTLEDLKQLVGCACSSTIPPDRMKSAFFEIIRRTESYIWAEKFFTLWARETEALKGKPDPLSRIHLSTVFRHIGKLEEAVKVTNVVEFPVSKFRASPSETAILATIRGAVLMDIYERHNDPTILKAARLSLGKAWANSKSEHASLAYKRLEKLETELSEKNYRNRVNDAFAKWGDWTR